MRHTITTPVEGFTGTVAGVAFADGEGETADPNALAYFRRHGYGVEPVEPVESADDSDSDNSGDVTEMPTQSANKADWVAYAVAVHGADHAEADGKTKTALIAEYGDH